MSAVISPCGTYRYRLEREVGMVGPVYAFFGINPSEAGAVVNDATVRKWIGFTKVWGGRRFLVGNVSPYRAKDVRKLATATQWLDIGRKNQRHLMEICDEADVLVPCWGNRGKVPKLMHQEIDALASLLFGMHKPVMHLGLTKSGDPKHPQMLGYNTPLTEWSRP